VVMTEVSRSMDAIGVLSLREERRDLKVVVTTILSSSSDMLNARRDGVSEESAVAQCLVLWRTRVVVTLASMCPEPFDSAIAMEVLSQLMFYQKSNIISYRLEYVPLNATGPKAGGKNHVKSS